MHIVLCYNHRSQGKRIHELEDKLACVLSKVRRLEKKMDRMPAKKKEYSDNEGEKLMHLIAHLSPEQDKDRRAIVKTLALQSKLAITGLLWTSGLTRTMKGKN